MVRIIDRADDRREAFPRVLPGEIHIWSVSLNISDKEYFGYTEKLSEKEFAKVAFFKTRKAKASFVASHGALRIILSNYLGVQSKLLRIGHQIKGKPYSKDDKGLHFNMSNSGILAVIAFSRDSEVGIDIELIRPLHDLDELIIKNFSPKEAKFICTKSNERLSRFFRFWTIKESYLKAIGEGMRLRPDQIEFNFENDLIKSPAIRGVFEEDDWNLKEFSPSSHYVGTVAFREVNTKIRQFKFKLN